MLVSVSWDTGGKSLLEPLKLELELALRLLLLVLVLELLLKLSLVHLPALNRSISDLGLGIPG